MNINWLNKNNNSSCILFFNGWGMDQHVLSRISFDHHHDVCMFNNYIDLNPPSLDGLNYDKLYLIAWSMGVWVASQVCSKMDLVFDKTIAINGTENPINDQEGIPNYLLEATLNGWNERNRNKFNLRMVGGKTHLEEYKECMSKRMVQDQQHELSVLKDQVMTNELNPLKWSKVIIGTQDQIFPYQNLLNYWQGKTNLQELEMPHFPFTPLTFSAIFKL